MRILLYESLPDIERAVFIKRLRKYLRSFDHEIFCLADAQTDFRLDHGQGELGRINCIAPLCHNIIRGNRDSVFVYTPSEPPFSTHTSKYRKQFYKQILTAVAPDCIIVWNGLTAHHNDFIETVHKLSMENRVHYLEAAWLPQKDYIYCDSHGINGNSSIASQQLITLTKNQQKELYTALAKFRNNLSTDKRPGTILVPLQIEHDTSILHFSPFKKMQEFVSFLEEWIPPGYQVTIRPHPKSKVKSTLTITRDDFIVDNGGNLFDLLACTDIVIGINSTTLIEAMAFECTTFAFGKGVFSCLESVCIGKETTFVEALSKKQDVAPLLYDLTYRRQIPVHSLDGLASFLNETTTSLSHVPVARSPYPLNKLLYGELRYWVGKILKKAGMIS